MNRQKLGNGSRLISMLLFPIILYYFSPYVIIFAANQGVINGSFIVFITLFLVSLFMGRFWCGWLCPGSGLNMVCSHVNPEPAPGGKRTLIKYFTWAIWIGVIVITALKAGGYSQVDFFFMTVNGVSMSRPSSFIVYYVVVGLFVVMNFVWGRAALCKYLCWMAPFMTIGMKIRDALRIPSLHLEASPEKCVSCRQCTRNCPRGLDVHKMVKTGDTRDIECINCGTCVDICPVAAVKFSYLWSDPSVLSPVMHEISQEVRSE